jgi:hypothetical protein
VTRSKAVERVRKECGFAAYCETSAITGRGVGELCEEIAKAIDWKNLALTSRPELFQCIRDEFEARRKNGEITLFGAELDRAFRNALPESAMFSADKISASIRSVFLLTQEFVIKADLKSTTATPMPDTSRRREAPNYEQKVPPHPAPFGVETDRLDSEKLLGILKRHESIRDISQGEALLRHGFGSWGEEWA